MNRVVQRIADFKFHTFSVPIVLLALCLVSYGLLIPWLGFYWDDWAFVWISQKLGSSGLARYFSTNRPIWGLIYRFTTSILGEVPWHWQLFGLFWRWITGVTLWWLLRLLWPRRPEAAAWVSILFIVYPGFNQQPIAITYGHFFIILSSFFLSLCFMILALRRLSNFWLFTGLALATSLLNLLSMEYFFLLELIRPQLIWIILDESIPNWRQRLKRTVIAWFPYLITFLGAVIWRTIFFRYQTQNYETLLLDQFKKGPLQAVLQLAIVILSDVYTASFRAWGQAFRLPNPVELGSRTTLFYYLIVILSVVILSIYLFKLKTTNQGDTDRTAWAGPVVGIGGIALLMAGWPFWLTQLEVALWYPNSRFMIPFMLGASLLVAGLLKAIPIRQEVRLIVLGVLVSLAIGSHFQTANSYRRDWNTQKTLFWQISWRIPQLEPGTTVLTNDMPFRYCSDNTLTSPLNYIYAPDHHSEQMSYMLYYPSVRLNRGLKELTSGVEIKQNYLAASFSGSTSQVVSIYFLPPACARVLDPMLEPSNIMLPELMRSAANLSTTDPILLSGEPLLPPEEIFGPEPSHGWCYYFEKADLARQQGDWEAVAALGEIAFDIDDYPNDPSERIPFIEGYAHVDDWEQAIELTRISHNVTPLMKPGFCRLWQRIAADTPSSSEKETALQVVNNELGCER